MESTQKFKMKKIGLLLYVQISVNLHVQIIFCFYWCQVKESDRVICHFYRSTTWRCQILDRHFAALAPKHLETRFIKIDAEKCNFLAQRLEIVLMPTVIMTKDTMTHDR